MCLRVNSRSISLSRGLQLRLQGWHAATCDPTSPGYERRYGAKQHQARAKLAIKPQIEAANLLLSLSLCRRLGIRENMTRYS